MKIKVAQQPLDKKSKPACRQTGKSSEFDAEHYLKSNSTLTNSHLEESFIGTF